MIIIDGKPLDAAPLLNEYPAGSVESSVLEIMSTGNDKYIYDSLDELRFELNMRREIVNAAKELNRSGLDFEVFRKSRANPDYWIRHDDGGFELKRGVKPSAAILDILDNGSEYGTECATAMMIVYYKALLGVFPAEAFDRLFQNIYLMNWHNLSRELRSAGLMRKAGDSLPGDRRYFSNPDVDPETPEWQGENVIDLGDGRYYGHGIGIHQAGTIIDELNRNRRQGADREAYLMDTVGRPDFKQLANLYTGVMPAAAEERQTA
jgi:protein-glutamine gamma-glutamyltransferase